MTHHQQQPRSLTPIAPTLIGADGKAIVATSLRAARQRPAGDRNWPQTAAAVRLSNFKPAPDAELP